MFVLSIWEFRSQKASSYTEIVNLVKRSVIFYISTHVCHHRDSHSEIISTKDPSLKMFKDASVEVTRHYLGLTGKTYVRSGTSTWMFYLMVESEELHVLWRQNVVVYEKSPLDENYCLYFNEESMAWVGTAKTIIKLWFFESAWWCLEGIISKWFLRNKVPSLQPWGLIHLSENNKLSHLAWFNSGRCFHNSRSLTARMCQMRLL